MTKSYFTVRGAGLAVLLATVAMVGPRQVQAQQPPLPVIVRNDITRSVPMFGTDNPAFQAFQKSATLSTSALTGGVNITTVPAGKRLVIEFVSVNVRLLRPWVPVNTVTITSTVAGVFAAHRLVLFGQGFDDFGNVQVSAAAQQVRLYADPGTIVTGFLTRSGNVGFATVNFEISGYFVDLPVPVDITP